MSDCEYEEIFLPIGISLTEADIIVGQYLRWHINKWTDNAAKPNAHPDDIKELRQDLAVFRKMLKWVHPELQEQSK